MELYSLLLRDNEQVDYVTAIFPNQHNTLYQYFGKYLNNCTIKNCTISAINTNLAEISLLSINHTKIKKRKFIKILKHTIDIRLKYFIEIKVFITFYGPKGKLYSKCYFFFKL